MNLWCWILSFEDSSSRSSPSNMISGDGEGVMKKTREAGRRSGTVRLPLTHAIRISSSKPQISQDGDMLTNEASREASSYWWHPLGLSFLITSTED